MRHNKYDHLHILRLNYKIKREKESNNFGGFNIKAIKHKTTRNEQGQCGLRSIFLFFISKFALKKSFLINFFCVSFIQSVLFYQQMMITLWMLEG